MELVAVLAVLVGAALHSATGFGYALVAAPALAASSSGPQSVGAIAVLGIGLNIVILAGDGERPRPDLPAASALAAWALPGLPVGAILLGAVPENAIEGAIGVAILAAVATRVAGDRSADDNAIATGPAGRPERRTHPPHPVTARDGRTAVAGLACGALTTTTAINGPPLVLRLLAAGSTPAVARDTLAVLFTLTGVGGVAALLAARAFELPDGMWLLALATLGGQIAGRPLLERLHPDAHERLVLTLLAAGGVAALAGAAT